MRNWLCRIVLLLSSFLVLLVCTLWILSYGLLPKEANVARYHARDGSDWIMLSSSYGSLGISVSEWSKNRVAGPHWKDQPGGAAFRNRFPAVRNLRVFGFGYYAGPSFGTDMQGIVWMSGTSRGFSIPYWFVALLCAIVPMRWLLIQLQRLRASRIAGQGTCITCGYDLRATPDRCPECGKIPATAQSAPDIAAKQ